MDYINCFKIIVEKDCITFFVYNENEKEIPLATYPIFLDEDEGVLIPISAFYLLETLYQDGWQEIGESELVQVKGGD